MPTDAFISYASDDKDVADAICDALEQREMRCWIAPRDILPGAPWAGAIVEGIESSRLFVLVFSSRSNLSPQVLREVESAVSKRIPIITFRIEDVAPSKDMEYFIKVTHWLDACSGRPEDHLELLVDAAARVIARPPSLDTPAPAPAAPRRRPASDPSLTPVSPRAGGAGTGRRTGGPPPAPDDSPPRAPWPEPAREGLEASALAAPEAVPEFEIGIQEDAGQYIVEARSPLGHSSASAFIPPPRAEIEAAQATVGATPDSHTRDIAVRARPPSTAEELERVLLDLKRIGGDLFDRVFSKKVRTAFQTCQAAHRRMRVRLRLCPSLLGLPWELLYDTSTANWLALSNGTPLVRSVGETIDQQPAPVDLPLRALVVIACPRNYPALDAAKERADIEGALQHLTRGGFLRIDVVQGADTYDQLHRAIWRLVQQGSGYNIFHFICHGTFFERQQDSALLFEDAAGAAHLMAGEALAQELASQVPPQLIVLNACEVGRTSAQDPLAGIAVKLALKRIPAVIVMQRRISDRAAVQFARELYTSLVDYRVPIDQAVVSARQRIRAMCDPSEWSTPVLYLSHRSGEIFRVPPPDEMAQKVRELGAKGEWRGAFHLAESLLQRAPEQPDARPLHAEARAQLLACLRVEAEAAAERADWGQTLELCREALALDAADAALAALMDRAGSGVELQRAVALLNGETWQDASGILTSIAKKAPKLPGLEEAQARLRRAQQRLADYERAQDAIRRGRWSQARAFLARFLEPHEDFRDARALHALATRKFRIQHLMEQVQRLLEAGDAGGARRLLASAPQDQLDDPEVTRLLEQANRDLAIEQSRSAARAAEEKGLWAEAARAYEHLLELVPAEADLRQKVDACHARALFELTLAPAMLLGRGAVVEPVASWTGEFPYKCLGEALPSSSLEQVRKGAFGRMGEQRASNWRAAWDELRQVDSRLLVDAFLHPAENPAGVQAFVTAWTAKARLPGEAEVREGLGADYALYLRLAGETARAEEGWRAGAKKRGKPCALWHQMAVYFLFKALARDDPAAGAGDVETALGLWAALVADREYWRAWAEQRFKTYGQRAPGTVLDALPGGVAARIQELLAARARVLAETGQQVAANTVAAWGDALELEVQAVGLARKAGGFPHADSGPRARIVCGPLLARQLGFLPAAIAHLACLARRGDARGDEDPGKVLADLQALVRTGGAAADAAPEEVEQLQDLFSPLARLSLLLHKGAWSKAEEEAARLGPKGLDSEPQVGPRLRIRLHLATARRALEALPIDVARVAASWRDALALGRRSGRLETVRQEIRGTAVERGQALLKDETPPDRIEHLESVLLVVEEAERLAADDAGRTLALLRMEVLISLGVAEGNADFHDAARGHLEQALEINPQLQVIRGHLGVVYRWIADDLSLHGRIEPAGELLRKGIRLLEETADGTESDYYKGALAELRAALATLGRSANDRLDDLLSSMNDDEPGRKGGPGSGPTPVDGR